MVWKLQILRALFEQGAFVAARLLLPKQVLAELQQHPSPENSRNPPNNADWLPKSTLASTKFRTGQFKTTTKLAISFLSPSSGLGRPGQREERGDP